MKCVWNLLEEEGRTRQKLRIRVFSVLFTFLSLGDILDLPQALSHLTVSRNTLHFNNNNNNSNNYNRRILPSVGALELTTDINISGGGGGEGSGDRLKNSNNVRVPGFKEEKELNNWLHRVPQDKLLHALADAKLSQSIEGEIDEDEEESISISRTVEPQVLQRLESKFLKLFGMSKRPPKQMEKKLKVPKYLLDLYQKQNGEDTPMPTTNLNLPGRNTRTANTVRTFYLEPGSHQIVDSNHLQFNLESLPDSEEVTGAELRVPFTLRKENPSQSDDDDDGLPQVLSVKILLHDIIKKKTPSTSKKPKQFHLTQPITQPIDSKTVNLSKRQNGTTTTFYLTFDVFPAVSRWGKNRKLNHGLLLEIVNIGQNGVLIPSTHHDENEEGKVRGKQHGVRVKRDLLIPSNSNQGDDDSGKSAKKKQGTTEVGAVAAVIPTQNESPPKPSSHSIVLFTYSDDGHNVRKTRDAKTLSRQYRAAQQQNQQQRRRKNHRNKNKRRNLCARHNMFVDFTDVGWNDWIVAPPGYPAFHCSGECPFPMAEHLNATNHAVIQALVHSMNPGLVPPPCCVPTKYSSLSLLYTDSSDKIVLKNYNEMVVDSCGCS